MAFVSVVMPVFNGAAFLAESIRSILAQTHQHLELIIVDDGSEDGSSEIVRTFAARDARIRPLSCGHHGAQAARNRGVAAARGEFVAHIDQDDIALRERLAAQLAWMRANAVDVCGSCTWVFGDDDYLRWVPERHDDIVVEFLFKTAMIHSTTLLPAAIARAHPFDEDVVYGGYELLTRLSHQHRLGNVPQVLSKYRVHAGQRSRLESSAVRRDRRRFRERHFHALFPESSAEDYAAVARVADEEPFANRAELERAEAQMERLAQTRCPFLGELMAERWAAARRRTS